jgi:predicted RNase H-related nuclease YkuK (DUF458 family)
VYDGTHGVSRTLFMTAMETIPYTILKMKRKGRFFLYFISPSKGTISLDQMKNDIEAYVQQDPEAAYKIVIGTDSHTSGYSTVFVTALIVHRVGRGARFYFRKKKIKAMKDLRHRIYHETELSLELMDLLQKQWMHELLNRWPLEIHIDIGPNGDTKHLIQEIVGWVTSVGCVAKIKPHSFGASSVADRFTS